MKKNNKRKTNKLVRLIVAGIEQSFKSKTFVILNIIMLIGILAMVNFKTVVSLLDKVTNKTPDKEVYTMMLKDETGKYESLIKGKLKDNMKYTTEVKDELDKNDIIIDISYDERKIIKAKIISNEYIDGNVYQFMEENLNILKDNIIEEKYKITNDMLTVIKENVEIERQTLKIDNSKYKEYEGIIMSTNFVLYFILIFLTSSIASTIGMEKISRTTEYMLTGISEKQYLWFNIIQCNLLFILQVVFSFVYVIFANMICNIIQINFLGASINNIQSVGTQLFNLDQTSLTIIAYGIVQGIIVGLILSIVQAVITSKVSNITDVSNSTMIVILLVIFGTMIVPNFITATGGVSLFLKILSFVPVFSLAMVPKLYLLDLIPKSMLIVSILISLIVLILSVIVGSKMFKKGLLQSSRSSNKNINLKEVDYNFELTKVKMKSAIFKIAASLILFFVLGNIMAIVNQFIYGYLSQHYNVGINIRYILDLIQFVIPLLIPYLYVKDSIEVVEDKTSDKGNKIFYIFVGLGFCLIAQIVSSFISTKLGIDFDMNKLLDFKAENVLSKLLLVTQIAILPAIFEELLFRKGLIGITRKISPVFAILISSAAFAIMHGNFTQAIFAFIVGCGISYVYIKTNSILPCMFIHFANNLLGTLGIIYGEDSSIVNVFVVIGIILGSIGILLLIARLLTNKKSLYISSDNKKLPSVISIVFTNYFALFAVLLYVVMMFYFQVII